MKTKCVRDELLSEDDEVNAPQEAPSPQRCLSGEKQQVAEMRLDDQ